MPRHPLVRFAVVSAAVATLAVSLVASARADVALPKVFGDHMVLQRDQDIPVWGEAAPGEQVTVRLAGHEATATAGDDGRWMVRLPSLAAGGPHELTVEATNRIVLSDVLVGEVWLASGQSNMEWSLTHIGASDEIAAAEHADIRLFRVEKTESTRPEDFVAAWQPCTPETAAPFSAVAYFYGRELRDHLGVPVGLIETCWGGTPAEYWTPPAAFAADPRLRETSDHPHAQAVMQKASVLYDAMVAPLVPYGIRGAIWYQGESNVPMAAHYRTLFSGMIGGWRQAWGQGDFPFLYVQIAPWNYGGIAEWPRSGAPLLREAQLQTLSVPATGMVVTTDIGDVADIHPRNKLDVGRRLALAARAIAYGEEVVYSGPLYRAAEFADAQAVVRFDHAAGGLAARDGALTSFEIAGADRRFVEAEARIVGETIVVSSPHVRQPAAVRFGFSDTAQPNLFNAEGLPASPFRTDDWPVE